MVELSFYLTDTDTGRLFTIKRLQGRDDDILKTDENGDILNADKCKD